MLSAEETEGCKLMAINEAHKQDLFGLKIALLKLNVNALGCACFLLLITDFFILLYLGWIYTFMLPV